MATGDRRVAVGSEVSVSGVVLLSVRVCEVRLLVNCLVSEVGFVLVVLVPILDLVLVVVLSGGRFCGGCSGGC